MTSTLSIPLLSPRRHPTWYLLLWLPLLPLVSRGLAPWVAKPWEARPTSLGSVFLLAMFGAGLAFGLPPLLDRQGYRVRKEAELLRGPWLASLFLVQAAAAVFGHGSGLEVMLMVGTCFLIAAIPFGSEYQNRTLPGLLSQPVPRSDWWTLKMGLPALALALHWAVYLLTQRACAHPVSVTHGAVLLVVGAVAWASTPWWTFLSRGLLPGLVFSLTVPLITLIVLAMASDALSNADTTRVGPLTYDEAVFLALTWIAAPAYAIAAYRLGRRRWMQLEAPDQPLGEGGVLSLPMFRGQRGSVSRRLPVGVQLVAKEFRLQTATLLMGVAALVAGIVNALPVDALRSQVFYLQGGFLMISLATLVLAGATTVAEERRLGTLDGQLLAPVSRGWQWLFKVVVALVPASIMGTLVVAYAPPLAIGFHDVLSREMLVILLAGLFATACLVSSTSTNSLRALLVSLALAAGLFLAGSLAARAGHALLESFWNRQDLFPHNLTPGKLADLRSQVQAAAPGSVLSVLQALESWREAFPRVARAALLLPVGLALLLARRNFLQPDLRRTRLPAQASLCLLVLVAVQASTTLVEYQLTAMLHEKSLQHVVLRHLDWERTLSRGERELLNAYRNPFNALERTVAVPLLRGPQQALWQQRPRFLLPLAPVQRAALLQQCLLPEHIRELLEEDAARDPRGRPDPAEITPAAPTAGLMEQDSSTHSPATTFRMSPELMRRYGLIPPTPGTEPAPTPTPTNAPTTVYQMPPELMRRYGLIPPSPASTSAPPQPAPQPTP